MNTELDATISRLRSLDAKRTPHRGHSWVHCLFRKGKQYGRSTCWGEKGERIFYIEEERNPNAENDYQYYGAAPEMMAAINALVAEREALQAENARLLQALANGGIKAGELTAQLIDHQRFTGTPESQGDGQPCFYCGDPCNRLAGNPGKWPVGLPQSGQLAWHHMGCVSKRLAEASEQDEK